MGIGLGLIAALGWGIGDVVLTQTARRIGSVRLLVYFESAGLLAIGLLLLIRPALPHASAGMWVLMLGLALLNSLGALLLYRAFQIGTLALVSPLASANAIVTALLAFVTGERLPLLSVAGALLLVGGVVFITRFQYAGGIASLRGLPEALGVAVIFGGFYWAMHVVTPALGIYWPIFVMRTLRVVVGVALAGRSVVQVREVPFVRLGLAALLSTAAFLAFNLGLTTTSTTLIAALASLASAVTVMLARAMLHEQLSHGQWVGVSLILLGVLVVSR